MENLTHRVKNAFLDNRRKILIGAAILAVGSYCLANPSPVVAASSYQDQNPATEITTTNTITNTEPVYISPTETAVPTPTETIIQTLEEILKTIHANIGSLTGYACDDEEWGVVINKIPDSCTFPESVHAYFETGQDIVIPLDPNTSNHGVAHYRTTELFNSNLKVIDITTEICEEWNGQFVLSHGPCPPTSICLADFSAKSVTQMPNSNNGLEGFGFGAAVGASFAALCFGFGTYGARQNVREKSQDKK